MRILQVQDHIQEVVTPEDSPLQQEKTETDTVPDDPCFITRQLTLFTALLLRCRKERIHKLSLYQCLTGTCRWMVMTENYTEFKRDR